MTRCCLDWNRVPPGVRGAERDGGADEGKRNHQEAAGPAQDGAEQGQTQGEDCLGAGWCRREKIGPGNQFKTSSVYTYV